jgi:hypothetical protein
MGRPALYGRSLFRARNGMTAAARTPVLPEAIAVGAITALLRHCPHRISTTAISPERRFRTRAENAKFRPQAEVPELLSKVGLAHKSGRCAAAKERAESDPMRKFWPERTIAAHSEGGHRSSRREFGIQSSCRVGRSPNGPSPDLLVRSKPTLGRRRQEPRQLPHAFITLAWIQPEI